MWKANTSNLSLDTMRLKQEGYDKISEFRREDMRGITGLVMPCSGFSIKEFSKKLFSIINEASDLDKLIST